MLTLAISMWSLLRKVRSRAPGGCAEAFENLSRVLPEVSGRIETGSQLL